MTKKQTPLLSNKISTYFKANKKNKKDESISQKNVFSKFQILCIKLKIDNLLLKTKLKII